MVEEACPKDLESDLPSFLYIVVLWFLFVSVVVVVPFQFENLSGFLQGALLGVLESKHKPNDADTVPVGPVMINDNVISKSIIGHT